MWKELMWKKFTSVEPDDIRYVYLRDGDTCGVCQSNKDKSPYPSRYCHNPPDYCNDRIGSLMGLIHIWKQTKDGTLYLDLYEMTPGINDVGEFEQIGIDTFGNLTSAKLSKEYKDCDYDPSLSMDVSPEQAKEIIRSIPFMKQANIRLEDALGVKDLNLFEDKNKWMEAYQKRYDELKIMLNQKASVVPAPADLFRDDI